jgi:hypothetical protein
MFLLVAPQLRTALPILFTQKILQKFGPMYLDQELYLAALMLVALQIWVLAILGLTFHQHYQAVILQSQQAHLILLHITGCLQEIEQQALLLFHHERQPVM